MKNRRNIKPILFSAPMVQAILAGNKKQTRRVVTLPKSIEFPEEVEFTRMQNGYPDGTRAVFGYMDEPNCFSVRGYQVGDVLWVRERFCYAPLSDEAKPFYPELSDYMYFASCSKPDTIKWTPSIHMPKEASRIFLKVSDVKIESLQEITKADAIAEGIKQYLSGYENYMWSGNENFTDWDDHTLESPISSFKSLWQKINGIESWERNPLVWVYSFEQIDKPKDF